MASPLVISIPRERQPSEGRFSVTVSDGMESPVEAALANHESLCQRFISIKTAFVVILLFTVVSTSVSLVITNHHGLMSIVDRDIKYRVEQLNSIIGHHIEELFEFVVRGMQVNENFFFELTVTPNGTNLLRNWPYVVEVMWSDAQEQPSTNLEFNFLDGRIIGIETATEGNSVYYMDYPNATSTEMRMDSWEINITIGNTDISPSRMTSSTVIPPPYPVYTGLRNETRDYLLECNSIYWEGVFGSVIFNSEEIDTLVGAYRATCNKYGDMLGYFYVGVDIASYDDLLNKLAKENKGQFFIMDTSFQIVASSTYTPTYELIDTTLVYGARRMNVETTKDRWIKDAFKSLKGDYSDHSNLVTINGTRYYLTVLNWNQYTNIDWILVLLLDYDFLLGPTPATINRSIIVSVAIAVVTVMLSLIITYFTIKPLFALTSNMKKIAVLDLDSKEEPNDPIFIEMKRLYQSYLGMKAALKSFNKFVPTQIVSRIIRKKKEVVAELKFRQVTICFQDIAGFTSLSESMSPANLAKLTSEYMGAMTKIISKNGGTIDKYIGDCIMSLFNAPEEVRNHPEAAVRAAVECIQEISELNKEWGPIYGVEMKFRTGIHTGEVLIGNMGSDHRMNYTAFGDNVNIAARLEGVNKLFGSSILISKTVYKTLTKGAFITRKLGKIRVSGKSIATTVYEVIAENSPNKLEVIENYEKALKDAKANKLDDALVHLVGALERDPKDKASLHLQHRIKNSIANSDWSYIEDLVKY